MERSIKFLTTLIAVTGLTACAMEAREGPPAPVVQVTPRSSQPVTPAEPELVREPESAPAPVPEKKPPAARPAKRGTKVFAYKDPNAPPEPEPVAPAEPSPAQAAQVSPQQAPQPGVPPAPGQTQPTQAAPSAKPPERSAPDSPRQPDQQQVAKTEPKSQPAATPQPTPAPPRKPAPPAPAPLPPSKVSTPNLPPAAGALASQAEKQRQSGDYAGAAATLERSLRIAPREAYLWNRLARLRMEQGQSAQAGNLAARSNDLAGNKGDVKKDNWRVIAESKRRSGDVAGAGEAEKRAGSD